MKRKALVPAFGIIVLAAVLILAGVWNSGYAPVLKANWDIVLPRCEMIYAKDSGASFHGDGIRYHVFACENPREISGVGEWLQFDGQNALHDEMRRLAEKWMDEIEIPQEKRPEYEKCMWYQAEKNSSRILLFWNDAAEKLHIVEMLL